VVYLATQVRKVWLLVRGRAWQEDVRYLVDRISGLSNVEVLTQTGISGSKAAAAYWRRALARPVGRRLASAGAPSLPVHRCRSNTDWLNGSGVALDQKGFVLTGSARTGRAGR